MSRQILIKGSYPNDFEVYDDGTAKAKCVECGKEDEISADRYDKLRVRPGWAKTYDCLDCWKKRNTRPMNVNNFDSRQNDIQIGQSYNVAVQIALSKKFKTDEEFFALVEELHPKVFEHITKIKSQWTQ